MKSYVNYMSEITADELYEGLLGNGMFAEKMPEIFTSKPFYDYCKCKTQLPFEKCSHDYMRYDNMRNTGIARHLAIPNPFAYSYLCRFLSEHWETELIPYFQEKTGTQSFCYSQIHIQKVDTNNSLFHMSLSYSQRDTDCENYCLTLPISKKFKVTTDISNFFPSIYSHALAWALVGKDVAKSTKGDDSYWYNQLDQLNINLKYRETNGQLIGPHASNILSEIIMCAVDKEMQDLGYSYIRKIDDVCFYAESYEEAESFIRNFTKALKRYDLYINEKKTNITQLPERDEDWVTQLKSFFVGADYKDDKLIFKKSRLIAFVNLMKRLADETGNLAVYLYGMKIVSNTYLGERAIVYYINEVHQLVLNYTYLAPYLDNFVFARFAIPVESIKSIAINLYKLGISAHNYEACIFALYWSLKFNFTFELTNLIQEAKDSDDCVFLLLSYLYSKRINNKDWMRNLKEFAKTITDVDRFMLFIYESLPVTDLPTPEMKTIKRAQVSFIKSEYRK